MNAKQFEFYKAGIQNAVSMLHGLPDNSLVERLIDLLMWNGQAEF